MPPAALISFTASLAPSSKLVPAVAPAPDSSINPTIFTGCACASTGTHAIAATNPHLLHILLIIFFLQLSFTSGRAAV